MATSAPQHVAAASVRLPGLGMSSSLPEIHRGGGSKRSPRPPQNPNRGTSGVNATATRAAVVRKFMEESGHSAIFGTPAKTARNATAPTSGLSPTPSKKQGQLVPADGLSWSRALEPVTTTLEADRMAYVDVVNDFSRRSDAFRSAAVFCDALMHAAQQARAGAVHYVTDSEPGDPNRLPDLHRSLRGAPPPFDPVRAASACWSLDQMARNGACRETMTLIRDHLFPCLFVDFDKPPTAAALASSSLEEVKSNPYLAYDFYYQHFHDIRTALAASTAQRQLLAAKCSGTSRVARRMIHRLSNEFLRPIFSAWRHWVKGNRIDRFSKDLLRRHGNRDTRRVTLEAYLARWRLAVAHSKITNFKQRVYAVEYQLENTKNQFQLQCFRSDKYLRLVEELREELSQVREDRENLIVQVRTLQGELQDFQDTSRDRLNRYVSVGIDELNRWRRFVRRRVEADSARSEQLTFATSGEGSADAEGAGEDLDTGSDNTTAEIEAQLLHWCSGIMRQSVVSTVKGVTNWTSDWHSGEVLLLLMHYVFPASVPLAPLQEASLVKRVEQIVDIGKKIGVAHLPKPTDVMDGAGDMMILVAAELYNRFANMTRVRDAPAPFEPIVHVVEPPVAADANSASSIPPPTYDVDMFPALLADADAELRRLVDCDSIAMGKDQHVWRTQEVLNGYASYITRERMEGRAVVVVDKKDVARFCKFAKNRYADIAVRFKMPPLDFQGMWLAFDQQLDALRACLQRNYQDLRRIFNFYCRGKNLMSEADFWRFIGDIRVLDRNTTRNHVDKIFSIANDDTPPVPKAFGQSAGTDSNDDNDDDNGKGDADEVEEDDNEENSETELIPSEFVECLVRIAERKFSGKMLHDRFDMLMSTHVVAFACKSDTDKFKKEIQSAQTQTAVQKYQRDLIKVFNFYAKAPASKGGKKTTKTMFLGDFTHFVKEANIMSQALDETACGNVFSTVSSSPEESNKEIDHREFLEAIVCLSVFKVPSPFVPLDKKVEVLCSGLINNLRSKLKPAVTLAEVPLVTLKQV